jgi:hypothetical protein
VSDPSLLALAVTRQLQPSHLYPRTYTRRSVSECRGRPPTPPGSRPSMTMHNAPDDTLAICSPPNAHLSTNSTQGWGMALSPPCCSCTPYLPLRGQPTAAPLSITTSTHAHAHHHPFSRFPHLSPGSPPGPCHHMHHFPLQGQGLPSGTATPQPQPYPLAVQQQHWPWELRGTGKANPRTRPRREVRLLLLRRVSTATLEQ